MVSSARALACIRREALAAVVGGESSGRAGTAEHKSFKERQYRRVAIEAIPVSLPRSYGLRIVDDNTFSPGPARREYRRVLSFVVGHTLIVLYTWSGPGPFPATLERRLLSLLYSRATAHKL